MQGGVRMALAPTPVRLWLRLLPYGEPEYRGDAVRRDVHAPACDDNIFRTTMQPRYSLLTIGRFVSSAGTSPPESETNQPNPSANQLNAWMSVSRTHLSAGIGDSGTADTNPGGAKTIS
jgi:hypothetical protein